MNEPTFTTVEVETACALWEAMLEARDTNPALDRHWRAQGTVAMRHVAIAHAPVINAAWNSYRPDVQDGCAPFDWEFLPRVVAILPWLELTAADVTAACDTVAGQ